MKLVVNPPKPWPNWQVWQNVLLKHSATQAPVSTRKTRPTIMERHVERAVEGGAGGGWKRLPNASPPTWGS